MIKKVTYNSNLLKGTGLIQEMLVLIDAYKSGESPISFQKRVLEEGLLSKSTDNRTIDVVRNIFKTRFLEQKKIDVPAAIRLMREEYVSMDVIIQLFYIYTCRANAILGDFVTEVYFSKIHKGITNITAEDPKIFIREAIADGGIPKQWSQSTIVKVSEHINACLIDFGLTEKNKAMKPFRLMDLTANYLAHELHFAGCSDIDILYNEDWELFGLTPNEVAQTLERLSHKGTFLFQYSGEILKIGWSYNNMKEFIEHECR